MEVNVKDHFNSDDPYWVSRHDFETNSTDYVQAYLDLQLINHRTDRPERIIECWAELRKNYFLFWNKTLAQIPVTIPSGHSYKDEPITDILLEPLGKPKELVIRIGGTCKAILPKKSQLVSVFKMLGPIRRYVKKLDDVIRSD